MNALDKVKTLEELLGIRAKMRASGERLVFTNGCFDILHLGHARYLEEARNLGDRLLVAVNSDASVRKIKGPSRPIQSQAERSEVVAALQCVDYVVTFEDKDPFGLIEALRPDVLVKGADWPLDQIVGADLILASGGKVSRIPLVPNTSTTTIIEKIVRLYGRTGNKP
jgi:D-beta-D-heptose 7-phosphate kinase/D-beta-D-heptose 1-phosphate adenosyltransferase